MKSISIIIVNFNAGDLLSRCVSSALASTVPVEIIISDNRSSDQSLSVVRQNFPHEQRLTIIENGVNLGFAKANNVALKKAQGDFLLFLNPDCIIHPDTIEKMLSTMEKHPDAGMAGCLIRNSDGSEQAGCRRNIPTPWRTLIRILHLNVLARFHPVFENYVQKGQPIPDQPIEVEAISGAFMLVRRKDLEDVGAMDEGYFMHCEDLDWCMRFRQAGLNILFDPNVEITHIGGVCSSSRPISVEFYKHQGMIRFYRKFFQEHYPFILMWIVISAVGLRFMIRCLVQFFSFKRPGKKQQTFLDFENFNTEPEVKTSVPGIPIREKQPVIVTGATSLIGDYLLPELVKADYTVHAVSRNAPIAYFTQNVKWHGIDISKQNSDHQIERIAAKVLIHLAPLATLPPLIESLGSDCPKRIIAFGSTSLFTKSQSGYDRERAMALGLGDAEAKLKLLCEQYGIQWTLFRPTLVYKPGRDKNISTIADFVRQFGFFPLVGEGKGLRQPVHAEDLALACIESLNNSKTFGKAYNLSGGETLTYLDMVHRVAAFEEKNIHIVHIPLSLLRFVLGMLSRIPAYKHLNPEMANRINYDMCFDHQHASDDFNFEPRSFLQEVSTLNPFH